MPFALTILSQSSNPSILRLGYRLKLHFFIVLFAVRAGAWFNTSPEDGCSALVHVECQESISQQPVHSVYSARILEAGGCTAKLGDVIRFAAPGGRTGTLTTIVNAIDITPGSDLVVRLSDSPNTLGLPLVIRSSGIKRDLANRAFQCTRAGESGPSLHWKNRTVVMNPSLPQDSTMHPQLLLNAMNWAAEAWSKSADSDFNMVIGPPVSQRWIGFDWSNKSPNYNIVTVREPTKQDFYGEWMHAAGVVALTSITYIQRTGEIVDADIEINLAQHNFDDCLVHRKSCSHSFDLTSTLTHEFGHVLGLDHPDESLNNATRTTMFAKSSVGEIAKRWPSDDDIFGLNFLYPLGMPSPDCFGVPKAAQKNLHIIQDTGCTQTGTPPLWILLLLGFAAVLRFSQRKLAVGRHSV